MPHKDWCGKPCTECLSPCQLDEMIPCSPDCSELSERGIPGGEFCMNCDAIYRGDESMRKIRAIFNVDEEKILNAAGTDNFREAVSRELGWLVESAMYVVKWEEYDETENIQN